LKIAIFARRLVIVCQAVLPNASHQARKISGLAATVSRAGRLQLVGAAATPLRTNAGVRAGSSVA
jgi:hypothetical protein